MLISHWKISLFQAGAIESTFVFKSRYDEDVSIFIKASTESKAWEKLGQILSKKYL